jgi:hypothetical protein
MSFPWENRSGRGAGATLHCRELLPGAACTDQFGHRHNEAGESAKQ